MAVDNPKSTAQIAGHPIHPMLVPLPIAFLIATLLSDLVYWATGLPGWATASLWLLGAAVVTSIVAAAAGVVDFAGEDRIRALPDAWHHLIGNAVAMALALVNLVYRLTVGETAIMPWGLVMSLIVVLILAYTGWKGGELVYRHRVGVMRDEPGHR